MKEIANPLPTNDAASGSAGRALLVLRAVIRHGPVSPLRLMQLTGLNRSAVHRGIHALIEQDFVRYQLGKRTVIVTSACRNSFSAGSYSPEGVEDVSRAVASVLKSRRVQCDIGVLDRGAGFSIVETTDAERADAPEPFFDSDLVSVLLAQFDTVDAARITNQAIQTLRADSDAAVRSEYLDRYRQARYQGFLWNVAQREYSMPALRTDEMAIAVRFRAREHTMRNIASHHALADQLRAENPGLFPRRDPN